MRTYYEILELPASASQDEIRESYRILAEVWHPDRFGTSGKKWELANLKMKELNAAFDVLKDPQKRSKYDNEIKQASRPDKRQKPAHTNNTCNNEAGQASGSDKPPKPAHTRTICVNCGGSTVDTLSNEVVKGTTVTLRSRSDQPPYISRTHLAQCLGFRYNGDKLTWLYLLNITLCTIVVGGFGFFLGSLGRGDLQMECSTVGACIGTFIGVGYSIYTVKGQMRPNDSERRDVWLRLCYCAACQTVFDPRTRKSARLKHWRRLFR